MEVTSRRPSPSFTLTMRHQRQYRIETHQQWRRTETQRRRRQAMVKEDDSDRSLVFDPQSPYPLFDLQDLVRTPSASYMRGGGSDDLDSGDSFRSIDDGGLIRRMLVVVVDAFCLQFFAREIFLLRAFWYFPIINTYFN